MVLPRLIHPIDCKVQPMNAAGTLYDDATGDPVQRVTRAATITIKGQPKWRSSDEAEGGLAGPASGGAGYVLFRQKDLTAAGWVPRAGDRFAKIGADDVDLYVTGTQPAGHYPDQGGASLLKVYFADQEPARQTPGV